MMKPTESRLLLVEDDHLHRKDLLTFFTKRGYIVTAVITYQEAVEALETTVFAAAVIDIEIPETDPMDVTVNDRQRGLGFRLGMHIRQKGQPTAIVFRSAYGQHTPMIRQMEARGYRGIGYVFKSISMPDLESCITQLRVNPSQMYIDPRFSQTVTLAPRAQRYFDLAVPPNQQPWVERALPNMVNLTRMQRTVLEKIAHGHKREMIAEGLDRQPKSIETQVTGIYATLFGSEQPDQDGIAKDVVASHVYWIDRYHNELSRGE